MHQAAVRMRPLEPICDFGEPKKPFLDTSLFLRSCKSGRRDDALERPDDVVP